ncbi:MAG: amino acid ABC transporter substrate-binding protein [Aureispira sp.]|nr:amino acid ABC transporter substrate-binding protein [Aureispira sp.]
MGFNSCDPTSRIGNNNNNTGTLDPITGRTSNNNTNNTRDSIQPVATVDTIKWCDTIEQSATKKMVLCFTKIDGQAIQTDTVDIIEINPNSVFDPSTQDTLVKVDTTIKLKKAYNVAILMPFMASGFVPAPTKEIPGKSLRALEFYEGVRLALDTLEKQGINLFVNIYDTKKSTATVQEILRKQELQEADLIIGPVSSKVSKEVAKFAKENKIPMVSPFNSRGNIADKNPYYIQLNPSFEPHSKVIVDYVFNKFESRHPKKYLVLGMKQDTGRMKLIQDAYADLKNDINAKIPQHITKDNTLSIESIKKHLSKDSENIIIIPSYKDESFIYNALREINSLIDKLEMKKSYKLTVIGMSRWRYYERVNFEYYSNLNMLLTSEVHINTSRSKHFKTEYKQTYGISPREFGYIGYDVMLYFGQMLKKYSKAFPSFIWKEKRQMCHTHFQFEPVYLNQGALDGSNPSNMQNVIMRYQNAHINLLDFEEYELKKIN